MARILIVGGGQAGARAASAMRATGFGGSITLIGNEQHLPYERPPLSKGFLIDREATDPSIFSRQDYRDLRIEILCGRNVTLIDRSLRAVELDDGSRLAYDRLLLATGARPRAIEIPGLGGDRLLYLRSIDDARRIAERLAGARSVAIIGGGFIGLEVAASARKLGRDVTVIEAASSLLARIGCAAAGEFAARWHREAGIDIRLGQCVEHVDGSILGLTSGPPVKADVVIAGIGIAPDTRLAERAGLATDDGLIIDEHCRTSDPFIYGAGDATRQTNRGGCRSIRLESWDNANAQATVAAKNMLGIDAVHEAAPWLWSDQGALNIQSVGFPGDGDRSIVRGSDGPDGMTIFRFRGNRLVGGVTLNRGHEIAILRRMLAAGARAPDPDALADTDVSLSKIFRKLQPA